MDVFWEFGRNFKNIWVRGQKRSLKYFSNVGMSLARMRPENINLNFIFLTSTMDTVYENSPVPT